MLAKLRHIHARRRQLLRDLDPVSRFETWEETCVPSYCHRNLAAAYMSWWRLYAAVGLARRHARWEAVLDFGAAAGELRRILPAGVGRYDFIEHNDTAARYLLRQIPDAHRHTLASAPAGGYSCVFALDALEHNRDYASLLAELGEKLRPGGVLVLSGPTENALYRLGRRIAGFDAHYHQTNIYHIESAASRRLERLGCRNLPPVVPLFRLSAWRE
jgi:2-polyprenyl-3-methyl-5-hydroxy-6-metoxy-1,4-benzoquinol methylase